MGCCTSAPKPPNAAEVPKNFDVDPEESEHGGMVNTVAIARLSQQQEAAKNKATQLQQAVTVANGHGASTVGSPQRVDEHQARVMSLEGSVHSKSSSDQSRRQSALEVASENITILERMSQHKKSQFFYPGFKGDPMRILSFLNDYDLARLTQVNRQFHGLVEGYISIRYAKQAMRADWDDAKWTQLRLGSRGGGAQWTKLRRRLTKEECNVREELADELTQESFREKYESKSIPCLVRGCAQDWKAFSSTSVWTLDSLASRFPNTLFRFNDLHGEEILLKDYLLYARSTDDDSPLGLYDSQIGVEPNDARSVLLNEYKVPEFFPTDLFDLVQNDETRPPYRWILLGMPRSGTEMHIDPLETSAWVTVLSGRKKWCLFAPNTDDRLLGGVHGLLRVDDKENPVVDAVSGGRLNGNKQQYAPTACEWFLNYWNTPGTKVEGAITLVQGPGDTVFIPGGWKHIVLNLEETVAITHNYAPREGLEKIRKCVKATEPEFYAKWEAELKKIGLA